MQWGIWIIGLMLWMACSIEGPVQTAGDATETGNAFVRGKMVDGSGEPVIHAEVLLIPVAYNPVIDPPLLSAAISATDSLGGYLFEVEQSELYNVLCRNQTQKFGVLIDSLEVIGGDTMVLLSDTLRRVGGIRIYLDSLSYGDNGYFYLMGTDVFAAIDSVAVLEGSVILSGVPVGGWREIRHGGKGGKDTLVYDKLHVVPGDTADCPIVHSNRSF